MERFSGDHDLTIARLALESRRILRHDTHSMSYLRAYDYIFDLVISEKGEKTYEDICEHIRSHLLEEVRPKFTPGLADRHLFSLLVSSTIEYTETLRKLADVCSYLTKRVLTPKGLPGIKEVGAGLYRDVILSPLSVTERLKEGLAKGRRLEVYDFNCMRDACEALKALDLELGTLVYGKIEEDILMWQWSLLESVIDNSAPGSLLGQLNDWLRCEKGITRATLATATARKFLNMVDSKVDGAVARELIEELKFVRLLEASDKERLKALFQDADGPCNGPLTTMSRIFSDHVATKGQEAIELKAASDVISCLVKLRTNMGQLVTHAFNSEWRFIQGLDAAFKNVLRKYQNAGVNLARGLHDRLMKGPTLADSVETYLILANCLPHKDEFLEEYTKCLGIRLLDRLSGNIELEASLISFMNIDQGHRFTRKLDIMLADIEGSVDLNEEYKKVAHKQSPPLALEVRVLTAGIWPEQPQALPVKLVSTPQRQWEDFCRFYGGKHPRRRLIVQAGLGRAQLRASFSLGGDRTVCLVVSTIQMFILLQFNNSKELTLEAIAAATELPQDLVGRALAPLIGSENGTGVLSEWPGVDGVQGTRLYRVNELYSCLNSEMTFESGFETIPQPEELRPGPSPQVKEDRRHQVDACITRLLKKDGPQPFDTLTELVKKKLVDVYEPKPEEILARIENLINRDYVRKSGELFEFVP